MPQPIQWAVWSNFCWILVLVDILNSFCKLGSKPALFTGLYPSSFDKKLIVYKLLSAAVSKVEWVSPQLLPTHILMAQIKFSLKTTFRTYYYFSFRRSISLLTSFWDRLFIVTCGQYCIRFVKQSSLPSKPHLSDSALTSV